MRTLLICALVCLMLAGCSGRSNSSSADGGLTVSAAASLKDAFQEIAGIYKQQTGREVTYNFGASGTLEKQIESGAAVDVFASAGQQQMDELAIMGLLDTGSRKDFARNELVVIVPQNSKLRIQTLDDLKNAATRIAVGNPRTVPAGLYADEVFNYMQVDDAFRQKLVFAEDVRQVLDYVARGEVDAGLVYRTDAMIAGDDVKIAAVAPDASHAPITYPVAI